MVAKVYDLMLCHDGITRAVEIVNGSPKDPSYVNQWKKPKEEKKEKPKVNIQDRIREQMEDCLLYTSPSPRDGLLSRMPSSA